MAMWAVCVWNLAINCVAGSVATGLGVVTDIMMLTPSFCIALLTERMLPLRGGLCDIPAYALRQALGKGDLRVVMQPLARRGNIPEGVTDIPDPHGLVLGSVFLVQDCGDFGQDLFHRDLFAASDIEDLSGNTGGLACQTIGFHHVGDIGKVARLRSIPIEYRLSLLLQGRDKARNNRRILRIGILARAEHIEVAQADGLQVISMRKSATVLFSCQLTDRIRRARAGTHGLLLGQGGCISINGRRRGEDETSHPGIARGDQQIERALYVDCVRRHGVFDGTGNGTERGEMIEGLYALTGLCAGLRVANVSLDHLDGWLDFCQVLSAAGGEIIQNPDLVPIRQKCANEMRPDETCPSSY